LKGEKGKPSEIRIEKKPASFGGENQKKGPIQKFLNLSLWGKKKKAWGKRIKRPGEDNSKGANYDARKKKGNVSGYLGGGFYGSVAFIQKKKKKNENVALKGGVTQKKKPLQELSQGGSRMGNVWRESGGSFPRNGPRKKGSKPNQTDPWGRKGKKKEENA